MAERLAIDFAKAENWDFSEDYWHVAGQWHRKNKDEDAIQRCILAAAECLVSKAEKELRDKLYGVGYAAHWMGRGVEALRQAKGEPKRIKDLHRRFLDLQRQVAAGMGTSEFDVDEIPGFRDGEKLTQEAAEALVRGYDFEEAVRRLALVTRPTDFAALRKQLEEHHLC